MSGEQASEALKRSYRQVTANKYDITDYKSGDKTSQGLAETHEQMSDVYAAGTNDGVNDGEKARKEAATRVSAYLFDEETQK